MALFFILGILYPNGPVLYSWYPSSKSPSFCVLSIPNPMILDYILSTPHSDSFGTSHPVYLQDRLGLR